jgi:hypothetical protein
MSSPSSTYGVYTAEYAGSPNHIAIFVETLEDGEKSGRLFHVTGNVVIKGHGMKYQEKKSNNPEASLSYAVDTKIKIGTVKTSELDRFRDVCKGIPVPGPQLKLGGKRIDPSIPLLRCIEWTAEAVEALLEDGVVQA